MRELTFVGFLSRYVRELSLSGTNAISRLAREAAEENYRLREPLLLYALFTDRIPLLRKSIRNDQLKRRTESILGRYDRERMLQALKEEDPGLPPEYRKVWRSYLVRKDRKKAEAHRRLTQDAVGASRRWRLMAGVLPPLTRSAPAGAILAHRANA